MANKKRLIDANALVEKFRDHKDLFLNKMGGFQALLQREKGRVDELDNCIADVINAPTVDAVEVVRCRECYFGKGELICTNPKCTKSFYGCPVPPEHFCSYGGRKDHGSA